MWYNWYWNSQVFYGLVVRVGLWANSGHFCLETYLEWVITSGQAYAITVVQYIYYTIFHVLFNIFCSSLIDSAGICIFGIGIYRFSVDWMEE